MQFLKFPAIFIKLRPNACNRRSPSAHPLSSTSSFFCCRHYEALVANKMIAPAPPTPSAAPPPELQLAVIDPRISGLVRRRLAAQAREAKRKSANPPSDTGVDVGERIPKQRAKQKLPPAKKPGRVRKTGKSKLAPRPAQPPVPDPSLSTVLRLLHVQKVQPTHVGTTGKPAAVVHGKNVHFMQRKAPPL